MARYWRWLVGFLCAMCLTLEASGEAAFDFTQLDGVVATSAPMTEEAETAAPERTHPTEILPLETPPAETSSPEESAVFQMEVIRTAEKAHQGRILIYHTHTWEAYRQVETDRYQETEKWRTKDESYNVVAVGTALASALEALGYTVVHDTTAFEPPKLEDAYARSLTMLERRTEAGETYDLYIDLHRDAIASTSNIRRTVNIGGEDVARFMVLVGKGTTGGYQEKPDFAANQAIAEALTENLEKQCEGLSREVKVRTGRFNQHIAPCCILIECGTNENTLEEVLCGVPYLAQALADTLDAMQADRPPSAEAEEDRLTEDVP